MAYVIYNKESTKLYKAWERSDTVGNYRTYWSTERAARAALTRAHRSGKLDCEMYAIAEDEDFHRNIEKTELVTNLMTGEQVEQPVNTPRSCDVSSELYWSM